KQSRLDQLIATVEKTITHLEEDIIMQDEEKFTGFKEKIIKDNEEQYGKEIREKYGADTIDASNAKLRDMSQEEFQKMKTIEDELFTLLVTCLSALRCWHQSCLQRKAERHVTRGVSKNENDRG